MDAEKIDWNRLTGNPRIIPATDSTSAIQVLKADGQTPVVTVDTANRRVGIGTTAPAQPLHVKVDQNAQTHIRIENADATANGLGASVLAFVQDLTGGNWVTTGFFSKNYSISSSGWYKNRYVIQTGNATDGIAIMPGQDSTTSRVVLNAAKTAAPLTVDTTNIRVGIGTTAPQSNLHVVTADSDAVLRLTVTNPTASRYPQMITENYGTRMGAVVMQQAGGTQAAPSALTAGQNIGILTWRGVRGTRQIMPTWYPSAPAPQSPPDWPDHTRARWSSCWAARTAGAPRAAATSCA